MQSWTWEGGQGQGQGTELRRMDGKGFLKVRKKEQNVRVLIYEDQTLRRI